MRRLVRFAGLVSVLALALPLTDCAKNGTFDPTEFFSNDMFDTKKKLKGERHELFPSGVPGTITGVPPDLVKGYQPPPDAAMADQSPSGAPPSGAETPAGAAPAASAEAAPAPEEPQPKPKPKPKPKVARARAKDSIWDRKPATPPTQIEVHRPAAQASAPAQPPQQGASPWPDPKPQQQAGQSVWPDPPPPGTFSR
jgi:hypothetical protein